MQMPSPVAPFTGMAAKISDTISMQSTSPSAALPYSTGTKRQVSHVADVGVWPMGNGDDVPLCCMWQLHKLFVLPAKSLQATK